MKVAPTPVDAIGVTVTVSPLQIALAGGGVEVTVGAGLTVML